MLLFGQAIYARIVLPITPEVKGLVCPTSDRNCQVVACLLPFVFRGDELYMEPFRERHVLSCCLVIMTNDKCQDLQLTICTGKLKHDE
jgi:hypothetical protein